MICCHICGSELEMVSCPDGREGCLVAHFKPHQCELVYAADVQRYCIEKQKVREAIEKVLRTQETVDLQEQLEEELGL